MQQKPQQPCKFGDRCNKYAQGICTFLHTNQPGQGGRMGGQGMYPTNINPNFGGPRGRPDQYSNYSNNNQGNYSQNTGNTGFGTQHGNYGKSFNKPYNQSDNTGGQNFNPNLPPKGDEFTSKFCMSYQFNQLCKYEEKGKCSRIHGFDEQGKIRRVAISNQFPPMQPSKLGKFVKDEQTYFILRTGNALCVLTFNQETSQFANFKTWQFPNPELIYYFYNQKQNYVYFVAENPKTTLHDITIYEIVTGTLITIIEAHQLQITDVIHFSNDIVLSSSKDGTIRVWKIEGTNAVFDKNSSDHLLKTYSTGKNIQILFLDLSIVNGLKILSAGTNDNRVLLFLGEQMQYTPIVLAQQHALTYKIRYCTIQGVTVAFIITWTQDLSGSSVIAINLNEFIVSDVVTHSTKQHARNNIYLIEIIEDKLFVVTMHGNVTIYSLPEVKKVGIMLHKNPVNSIVSAEYVTKTNIKIPQIFVLESKYHQKQGSIGVYTIKP